MITFTIVPDIRKGSGGLLCPRGPLSHTAGVAQLVEHLICNQRVRGSNPFASLSCKEGAAGKHGWARARPGFGGGFINLLTITDTRLSAAPVSKRGVNSPAQADGGQRLPVFQGLCGQVAEWSKAADCKSAGPCGL